MTHCVSRSNRCDWGSLGDEGLHEQLPDCRLLESTDAGKKLDKLVDLVELDVVVLSLEVDPEHVFELEQRGLRILREDFFEAGEFEFLIRLGLVELLLDLVSLQSL